MLISICFHVRPQLEIKDEIYQGPALDVLPDLIVEPVEGITFATELNTNAIIAPAPHFFTGSHQLDGIFIAKGPQIKANEQIEGANIVDVLPTILYLLDVEIPDDLDGVVLSDIFKPSVWQQQQPHYVSANGHAHHKSKNGASSNNDEDIVEECLRSLGYLS